MALLASTSLDLYIHVAHGFVCMCAHAQVRVLARARVCVWGRVCKYDYTDVL
jgi:hypothetical protein